MPQSEKPLLPHKYRLLSHFQNSQLQNAQFTDASVKREGKTWKYQAMTLEIKTEQKLITEEEGSTQVGELIAVWSVF